MTERKGSDNRGHRAGEHNGEAIGSGSGAGGGGGAEDLDSDSAAGGGPDVMPKAKAPTDGA